MRVWTAVRVGRGLATEKRIDHSRGTNDNVIVTDVNRRGEKMTKVINIYDQRDMRTRERHARKIHCSSIIRQRMAKY